MAEGRYDPAGSGVHPRTAFALAILIGVASVAGIWWLIFIGDPVQYESPDCSATIESAQDIIVKGCLDWGEVASTLFAISVYAAILLGLPAVAIAVARSMWTQGK